MSTSTLKILRELKGYKQERIAEVLATTQNTYSRIERNPKKLNAEQVQLLAEFYGVTIEDLLSDAPPIITFRDAKEQPNPVDSLAGQEGELCEMQRLREEVQYLRQQNLELIKAMGSQRS